MPPSPPQAARRPGRDRVTPPAAARRRSCLRVSGSLMSLNGSVMPLLSFSGFDDEGRLGAPADRDLVAGTRRACLRLGVLHVERDRACGCVHDVLGRHADVRALADLAGEVVLLAAAEPHLLRADADRDLPASAGGGGDADGGAVGEAYRPVAVGGAGEEVRDSEE